MLAQSLSRSNSQKRLVSITLVAAIHVAAIYALVVTLKPVLAPEPPRPPIIAEIFRPKMPPPSHPIEMPKFLHPTAPPVPIPPLPWETPPNPTTDQPPTAGPIENGPPVTGPTFTPARALANTHSIPDYPPVAARLNEQGSVRLSLGIDERGYVIDASVVTSSGYDVLDAAAVAWVKAHWRYQPAMRDGVAVPARTEAMVTFRLTNRQG